ncbi:hypothetical protein [Saccharopolyspora hattusasensis]|uniref:hypothetical protein n=1 Tax=Saccharopolyspora hattusasensis TaxID=1128679 RepID=UPI003D970793
MNAPDTRRLGQMMRGVIIALGVADDDLEAGRYDAAERDRLAVYCDNLSAALRADSKPGRVLIVDAKRADA